MPTTETGRPRRRRSRNRLQEIPPCIALASPRVKRNRITNESNATESGRNFFVSNGTSGSEHPQIDPMRTSAAGGQCNVTQYLPEAAPSELLLPLDSYDDVPSFAGGIGNSRSAYGIDEPQDDPPDSSDNQRDPSFLDGSQPISGDESDLAEHIARERSDNLEIGSRSLFKITNWRVIWALLMTNGTRKFTKDQYQSVRNFAGVYFKMENSFWKSDRFDGGEQFSSNASGSSLPHYSTLQKTFKPFLLNSLAPCGRDHTVPVDISKPGARSTSISRDGRACTSVRIILPSEFARADMATPDVWNRMRSTSLAQSLDSSAMHYNCVDALPVVASRSWFYGPQKSVTTDNQGDAGLPSFAEHGDTVDVILAGQSELNESLGRCFAANGNECVSMKLRGVVSHTWTVHHENRKEDEDFREDYPYEVLPRDFQIASVFNFVRYRSPTDKISVSIPDLPVVDNEESQVGVCNSSRLKPKVPPAIAEAMKIRRQALKERRSQLERAWMNWEKPLLKPGDFVVLLRPCPSATMDSNVQRTLLTSVDRNSRICVVHRFWSENEERSRHVFWVHGGVDLDENVDSTRSQNFCLHTLISPMDDCSERFYKEITSFQVVEVHSGKRGHHKSDQVSSVGFLDNGEAYFIYRFVLYWDGFEIHPGKSSSGNGLYMQCLNLPRRARSSSNSVRILSLTPPGVRISTVLQLILPDILQGMQEGFLDYDGDGNRRRLFLDLVGFLGDTPALNSELDVLGHTAISFCHLCRYKRWTSTLVGSKYTSISSHGDRTALRRGFFQHAAMHDSGATGETCRIMGVKSNPNSERLPLHSFRKAFMGAKNRIPTTSEGLPLLPCVLDPYRASFVAPDHLLTGHLKDCISLALKLLPSRSYRVSCEKFIICLLKEVGLPIQNSLVDHEKKKLYSMSMTDLYSLSIVSEQGLLRGCKNEQDTNTNYEPLSSKCKEAITIVGSICKLIAEIWWFPEMEIDGERMIKSFQGGAGSDHISHIQRLVVAHVEKIEKICSMDDGDTNTLLDPRCSRALRTKLSNLRTDCITAIKTVDKPNVHRLVELAFTTMPMLGHISSVGELVLEKAHQSLKRALKQSNNKEFQVISMKNIAFDDWQGRLSLVAPMVFDRNEQSLLCCYRLLAGRDAVSALKGCLRACDKDQVVRAMGPEFCMLTELKRQGKSVLSQRHTTNFNYCYSLKGNMRTVEAVSAASTTSEVLLASYIRRAFLLGTGRYAVFVAPGVTVALPNGIMDRSFQCGDIIETLCCRPSNPMFHFPFLVQTNCSKHLGSLVHDSAPSVWCVTAVIRLSRESSAELFYVAVRPCLPVEHVVHQNEEQSFKRYKVDIEGHVSFALIDRSMRKVGIVHECADEGSCRTKSSSDGPICSPVHQSGNTFLAITRSNGFPPRQG